MLNLNIMFSYFFFGEVGNDTMFNIAMLYKETVIILLLIMYIIIALIIFIIENFNHEKNKFPIYFNKQTESTLDIIFVVFPTLVIAYLIIPAVGYIYNMEYNLNNIDTLFNVFIIGHQWYWTYEYSINICNDLNNNLLGSEFIYNKLSFDSLIDMTSRDARLLAVDKRLVLPSNAYINLSITSEDVIHSWAIPQLGIKVDAIPGRLTEFVFYANFNGIYYGQCSELCGVNHGFMPICVEVVSYFDFLDFLLISLNLNPSGMILNSFYFGNLKFEELYY
jgi:cytochrome c oxidase subunit 2